MGVWKQLTHSILPMRAFPANTFHSPNIADSVFELQKKLDILYEVAVKLGLVVNMDKSKVVVFLEREDT